MDEGGAGERRQGTTERRRYTRRADAGPVPPYFETFDRIALALEQIAAHLAPSDAPREVRMPDVPQRSRR